MIPWSGRRPSWRSRYALALGGAAVLALGCWAMFAARPAIEPAVRALHAGLALRWRAIGPYEPTDYVFYAAFPAVASAAGLLAAIWGMATHRRTDAKVDAYLASRLPEQEVRRGEDH